jgi:hypothetical protein
MVMKMSECYGMCEDCAIQAATPQDIVYEIHITVKNADVDKFKEACQEIGVKPVLLDLQKEGLFDLMTSSVYKPETSEFFHIDLCLAQAEALTIIAQLTLKGFTAIRSKIETVPWNPAIRVMKTGYGESHLAVYCDDVSRLKSLVEPYGGHVSNNVFKKVDTIPVIMITLREYNNDIQKLLDKTDTIEAFLREKGYGIHKKITESFS